MSAPQQAILGASAPVSSVVFSDDFNAGSIDVSKWTKTDSVDVTITETSSQLWFAADGSYSGSFNLATLVSVPIIDFTGLKMDMDVLSLHGLGQDLGSSGGCQLQIVDTANSNNSATIYNDFGDIGFQLENNGSASSTSASASTNDAKWRIQHDSVNNKIKFWTFTSGVWTLRFTSAAMTWNPTSVRIHVLAYIYGVSGAGATTKLDNIIVQP